jgi:hypothetical protein
MEIVPEVKEYARELAYDYGLPNDAWGIGVDLIAYRDGDDGIGWHADDTQGTWDVGREEECTRASTVPRRFFFHAFMLINIFRDLCFAKANRSLCAWSSMPPANRGRYTSDRI